METNEHRNGGNGGTSLARTGGQQEIDPGMYTMAQNGTEVGHVAVIQTGTTTRTEHYFLYTATGSSPARAPYTFPRQGGPTVSIAYTPCGADPGTTFNAATYRSGLGIQNRYIVANTTDYGVAP